MTWGDRAMAVGLIGLVMLACLSFGTIGWYLAGPPAGLVMLLGMGLGGAIWSSYLVVALRRRRSGKDDHPGGPWGDMMERVKRANAEREDGP